MENNQSITYKENYVEAISEGPKTLGRIIQLWGKIIHVCKEISCFNIINISNSTTPTSVTEALIYVESFEYLEITREYRIAMVEQNPIDGGSPLLVEILLSSHGMDVKSFFNLEDAKNWLFFGRKI